MIPLFQQIGAAAALPEIVLAVLAMILFLMLMLLIAPLVVLPNSIPHHGRWSGSAMKVLLVMLSELIVK